MIEFQNVTKVFEEDVVLNGVSFRISRGETKIILGASGSGKSTILKLILGLIRPDSGSIFIEGQDITQMPERELVQVRKRIGMVFQEGALFDSMSVRENVGYRLFEEARLSEERNRSRGPATSRLRRARGRHRKDAGRTFWRDEKKSRHRTSSGRHAHIILYDEPTAGLDPITKRHIVELMIKLRDLEGVTSVFVTHDLQAAGIIATSYAVANGADRSGFWTAEGISACATSISSCCRKAQSASRADMTN